MTFTIEASWIKEIRDGKCDNWNYDYKEYIFNENYIESAWIRIPQNAHGIKAMDYSTGHGIQAEYNQVYLETDGVITTLFDINYCIAKTEITLTPEEEIAIAIMKLAKDTSPVTVSFGYSKGGFCHKGLVIKSAPSSVIKAIVSDKRVFCAHLEEDGLHISPTL